MEGREGGKSTGVVLSLRVLERLFINAHCCTDDPLLENNWSGRVVAVFSQTLALHGAKKQEDQETSHRRKRNKEKPPGPKMERNQPFRL